MDRHPIWFNGKLVPFEEAKIHVLSHVVHYGSSVFEGIRCYNTARGPAVFRLREHMRRLLDSARIYRMEVPYTLEELEAAALETIRASGLKACYIRPVVFRGMGSLGVNPLKNPVEVAIAVWDWGAYLGDEALEQGVDVQVSTWNRMAPNTLPAMAKAGANYANAALVKMEAVLNGYSEGIMLSVDGYVAEGSGENLFLVRDGVIYTAPLTLSILPGITRDAVITLARDLGYTVIEQPIPREALYIADELFFTGTAAEITPIRSVDRYTIGQGRRGPVTEALQRAFFEIVREGKDPYGWLTFVEVPREASVSS
ncbi:branched-chain amino acid transaminase [Rhodothermus marinus]|uniref:Branched-chain-amino-acid aminotransferase n=1 Tax=Rhodothermus marinus (strain ATCC 43812 / DSM 4252 / R-10) TaxID=518766 RepID=D0MGI8_RHOM4|nr:branched-chain amino acid transaminase [Rhodothermus marinus]ACY49551.1 branched-chain amino acid aminotransferase [Rhodothermus marinus DSM 4252]